MAFSGKNHVTTNWLEPKSPFECYNFGWKICINRRPLLCFSEPLAPSITEFKATGTDKMKVTWEAGSGSTQDSYPVQYKTTNQQAYEDATCPDSQSTCEFTVTDSSVGSVAGVEVTVKVVALVGSDPDKVESDPETKTGNTSKYWDYI